MRGMFTAGVLDVFMEEGIELDGLVGVSAGAIAGCNYKSGQVERTIRYNAKYCKDPRYASIGNLIFTGDLYSKKFAYEEIPNKLDPFDSEAFAAHPMEFYVVCTDVTTGHPVYHLCETGDAKDITWMRASASMPLAARVVDLDGFRLLDGGVADPIPLKFMESIGYEKNIVVLTQPRGFVKKASSAAGLMNLALSRYPKLAKAMKVRPDFYNQTLEYIHSREDEGEALVICPEEDLRIGKVERDPKQLWRVYDHGRKVCSEMLSQIREYLEM